MALIKSCLILLSIVIQSWGDLKELPHCINSEQRKNGTLDGKVTTIDSSGSILWSLDTGPGPLLISNIHNVELTNKGEWVRIIPSMSGSLYKFNGRTIDAIPINADSLLKSSFVYSNDLIIAGGREVRTYGLNAKTGKHIYSCSIEGCHNVSTTHNDNELEQVDDVIIVERSTSTVRAHEPRTGIERWNFSVGHHNIKLPYATCLTLDSQIEDLNLTAVLPEGLLIAYAFVEKGGSATRVWDLKLNTPIVKVWKWNGLDLKQIDLFQNPINNMMHRQPAIYLGMHHKQLYIHESMRMINSLQHSTEYETNVAESKSITRIPWKPITANNAAELIKDDSTALSVLYSSEYVNGNGYYLYMETDDEQMINSNTSTCAKTNQTLKVGPSNSSSHNDKGAIAYIRNLWCYWKEILVISLTTALVFNAFLSYGVFGLFNIFNRNSIADTKETINNKRSTEDERTLKIDIDADCSDPARLSETSDSLQFSSRYANDFEIVQCLGKGGYGIVFEVKQKIDECAYAIKRIKLPREKKLHDRVLREVKALANLDHNNIVRYFNSWVECPPNGWADKFDKVWLNSEDENDDENESCSDIRDVASVNITMQDNCNKTNTDSCGVTFESASTSTLDSVTISTISTVSATSRVNGTGNSTGNSTSNIDEFPIKPNMYLYIQMQLCLKDSLKEWLLSNPNRSKLTIINIYTQILNAVIYVHGQGLIHRDLKPSNIFFSKDGKIKVGDFGLATRMNEHDTDTVLPNNTILKNHTRGAGTTLYMSPEQLTDQHYNYKVDIFSLGLILFELLEPFSTDMERYKCLCELREGNYPAHFSSKHAHEYKLLKCMLSEVPGIRPNAEDILKEVTQPNHHQMKTPPFES